MAKDDFSDEVARAAEKMISAGVPAEMAHEIAVKSVRTARVAKKQEPTLFKIGDLFEVPADVPDTGKMTPAQEAIKAAQTKAKIRAGDVKQPNLGPLRKLPFWPESDRALPNHIARSSLFAPIQRGRRKAHRDTEIVSRADCRILFSGDQLDEADCDVWLQALHEARSVPLGEPVIINRAEFLKSIGRQKGSTGYDWLHQAFNRLAFGMIAIESKRYVIGKGPSSARSEVLHLIDGFSLDPAIDEYVLRIDPRWLAAFSNREFSRIDWQKRQAISKRTDLAKRLQRLIAASGDEVQRYSVEWLKEVCCFTSPIRKFREALKEAIAELERLEIIAGARLEISTRGIEQVRWNRIKTTDLDNEE